MKLKRSLLMLTLVMFLSTAVMASASGQQEREVGEPVEIDFSIEGKGVEVLTPETGLLEKYDHDGVKTIEYLSEEEVEAILAEAKETKIEPLSYDTGEVSVNVPLNIDGNQGNEVGSPDVVAPHTHVNLHVVALPQTTMPTINVAFKNNDEDDTVWRANVSQGQVVRYKVKYYTERYVAQVSTNEANSSTATVRSYTSN